MIPQMVVAVRNRDIEHNPAPELLQVPVRIVAVGDDPFGQFEVAGSLRMARTVRITEQCHGRGKVYSPARIAPVETLGHKAVVPASEPLCPAFGYLDTTRTGQLSRDHLPCPGIFRISGTRELDDP